MDDSNLAGQIDAARGAWLSSVDNSQKLKHGNRPQEVLAARFQQQRAREGVRNAEHNISRLQAQMEALKAQLKRNEQYAKAQTFLAKCGAISEQSSIDLWEADSNQLARSSVGTNCEIVVGKDCGSTGLKMYPENPAASA